MSISLSEAAAARVAGYLQEQPAKLGLRFGVRRTGCSGWAYDVDLADAQRDGDQVFEDQGIRIFVDADSLQLVDGTRIDFVRQGMGSRDRRSRAVQALLDDRVSAALADHLLPDDRQHQLRHVRHLRHH